jgi:hypothetical protein
MKRFLFISLLLFSIRTPMLSYSQDNSKIDYSIIDKKLKQFAAIETNNGRNLDKISYDLITIFLSLDTNDLMRWNIEDTIHNINMITTIIEHEVLLIKTGLAYIKSNDKSLFYENILKNKMEQYRKEIDSSLELLINRKYLVTDSVALHMITMAEEISRSSVESHDKYIEFLRSIKF